MPLMKALLPVLLMGILASAPPAAAAPSASAGLDLRAGDLVALLGSTFLERDYDHGYVETALTAANPGKGLRFRNLAWSADTVWGHSRSYFGPPAEGLQRLRGHLSELRPTVVICQYGAAESWAGPSGIPAFVEGYRSLLSMISEAAGQPRLILVSPLPVESLPPPAPRLDRQNENLAAYRDAIRSLAAERGLAFVDAFEKVSTLQGEPLTENGVHLGEDGYRRLYPHLRRLAASSPQGPAPAVDEEELRRLVLEKNRLFFHRWRPANETYLFGFRKHEQGNNAAEIPLFDQHIQEVEKRIAALLDRRQ